MQNWFSIETEAEFRRQEWERAVAADARVAQLKTDRVMPRWPRLPRLSLSRFGQKASGRLVFGLPASAHGDCAPSTN